jgi:hypothetical protein
MKETFLTGRRYSPILGVVCLYRRCWPVLNTEETGLIVAHNLTIPSSPSIHQLIPMKSHLMIIWELFPDDYSLYLGLYLPLWCGF